MEEKRYRESRLCRLLGNPIVYQLVLLLDTGGPLTPSKLAKLIGRQVSTVSIYLGKLGNADVVRYDTSAKETRYWLKHKSEMRGVLKMLERVVHASAELE
jgi:Mn-dependent DtxR family transcriptional regulator